MAVLVVIPGNELIFGMSLIKMLKWIGPSIDHWGTPNCVEHGLIMILSILLPVSFHSNNFRCLFEQVCGITNHDLQYQRLWRDREGKIMRLHFHLLVCRFSL